MSRTGVAGTRGLVVTFVVTLARAGAVDAAAALAVSSRQISESPSKSSTGRTLRHFWQRRQLAAMSPRPSSERARRRGHPPPATLRRRRGPDERGWQRHAHPPGPGLVEERRRSELAEHVQHDDD